jgi:hypothetical protein
MLAGGPLFRPKYLVVTERRRAHLLKGRSQATPNPLVVTSILAAAHAVRDAIAEHRIDIYTPLTDYPDLVYRPAELEALLRESLARNVFPGPIRTRSKLAKEAVCAALGYPAPTRFSRVKPRFPGQDLDVYVQQSNNLQVWNEDLSPTRRYVVIRVGDGGDVRAVRVVDGIELAEFDKTGTLTSKYQAKRRSGGVGSQLVSSSDTPKFVAELGPADTLGKETLASLLPADAPKYGEVLSIRGLHDRLLALVGRELEYAPSERLRGERLHRAACEILGLGGYADTGQFPDILCQALEVKLQTAGTIDLGLVTPASEGVAVTLSPRLRHCDVRYLVAYASRAQDVLRIEEIVISTGVDFFHAFQCFGGLTQNRKLQLRLPSDFFHAE